MRDGGFGGEEPAAVGEGIGGDIHDSHDEGATGVKQGIERLFHRNALSARAFVVPYFSRMMNARNFFPVKRRRW
ncbi:MAG: hypothetical protein BWY06_02707 [Candidatus Latescibacteria bacterium ADurb.Bin168]|nr:MAG: hypothetical protein BWY06_02707 [Candidatus Latescibacteria bacterium ADurb.Bin168]